MAEHDRQGYNDETARLKDQVASFCCDAFCNIHCQRNPDRAKAVQDFNDARPANLARSENELAVHLSKINDLEYVALLERLRLAALPPPLSKIFDIQFLDFPSENFSSSLSPASFTVLEELSSLTDVWEIIFKSDSQNEPITTFQQITDLINLIIVEQTPPPPPIILSKDFKIEFADFPSSNFTTSLSPSNFAILQGLEAVTNLWSINFIGDSENEPVAIFQEIIDFITLIITPPPEPEPEPEPGPGLTTNQKVGIALTAVGAVIGIGIAATLRKKH